MKNTLVISFIQLLIFGLCAWMVFSMYPGPGNTSVSFLLMNAVLAGISVLGFFLGFVPRPVSVRTVLVATCGPLASIMVLASPLLDLRSMSVVHTLGTLDLVSITLFVWFAVPCAMRLVLDGLRWFVARR